MTPTLAMAVMREAAISAFRSESFYTVQLSMGSFTAVSERFKNKIEADSISKACQGAMAVVTKAKRKEKSEKPPTLYDLTSLHSADPHVSP